MGPERTGATAGGSIGGAAWGLTARPKGRLEEEKGGDKEDNDDVIMI